MAHRPAGRCPMAGAGHWPGAAPRRADRAPAGRRVRVRPAPRPVDPRHRDRAAALPAALRETTVPTPRPSQGPSRPMAGGLVAVSLWGLAPVATRATVAHLDPLPLLVLRLGVAALVLLPWAMPVFGRLRRRSAARLAAAGALGLIGYNLPVTAGLQWLPASTAGLLLATEPVWVMVLGYVFLAERGGARAWLGSAVALGGVAVPYLAFAGTLSAPRLAQLAPSVWGELAFLAIGSTVAGMLLWNRAVLAVGSTRVSLLLYLEPAVSVLGAVALLGERVTMATIAGGLLILAGVAVASTTRPASRGGFPDSGPLAQERLLEIGPGSRGRRPRLER